MDNTSASGGYLVPAPGLSRRQIEDLLNSLIAALTGIPGSLVRPRWQPDPPEIPERHVNWCAFGIMRREMPNFPQVEHDGEGDGTSRVLTHETLHCLASFYGPDAEDKALALRSGLHVGQNREPLYHEGMAFVEAGELSYLPELGQHSMRWKPRCDLPLVFRRGPAPQGKGQAAEGEIAVLNIKEVPSCTGNCIQE